MSKVQSDTLYKDIEVLKGKLLSVKGEMSDDLYTLVEAKIKVAEEMIINLPEEASVADLVGITKLISELEVRYLDDKSVKEMSDTSKMKSFLAQLETVERNVELNVENAEEYMVEAREYWEKIRNSYDKSQQAPIIEKMTSIHLKCILEKAKIKKEVDMSKIPSFEEFGECRAIIDLLTEKRDGMDDMSRVTLDLWVDKIVDKDTGGINKEEIKSIILREKFWEILSGSRSIGLINGEEPQNAVMDVQNNVDPEMEYEEKLKALAKEYDVNWKKLKTKENEVAFIREGWRGKYKVVKMPYSRYLTSNIDKWDFRLKTVAVILNDNIEVIDGRSFWEFRKLKHVIFPYSLNSISESAFWGSGITSITMPSSLTSIGESAFGECNNLREVRLNEGLEEIGEFSFKNTGITSITMPNSLRSIGNGAFCECKELRDVSLNEGLREIDSLAFCNDILINSILLPNSLEVVKSGAFAGCSSLETVELNENLGEIGSIAFYDTKVNKVKIPSRVNDIGSFAFPKDTEMEVEEEANIANVLEYAKEFEEKYRSVEGNNSDLRVKCISVESREKKTVNYYAELLNQLVLYKYFTYRGFRKDTTEKLIQEIDEKTFKDEDKESAHNSDDDVFRETRMEEKTALDYALESPNREVLIPMLIGEAGKQVMEGDSRYMLVYKDGKYGIVRSDGKELKPNRGAGGVDR